MSDEIDRVPTGTLYIRNTARFDGGVLEDDHRGGVRVPALIMSLPMSAEDTSVLNLVFADRTALVRFLFGVNEMVAALVDDQVLRPDKLNIDS